MKVIAIDLETTGLNPREDRVRLVQMWDGKEMKILDVFKTPEVLDELLDICEDPSITKVFHNAKFDLSFVRVHAQRRVRYSNIFDTLLAEQVLSAGWSTPYWDKAANELKKKYPEYSLAKLVSRHLGIRLDKEMQRSNWGSKELTEEQLKYAAKDVEVLLPIYNIQRNLLELNNLIPVALLEFNTLGPVIEMELEGLPFSWSDAEKLREVKLKELEEALTDLKNEARRNQKSRQITLFGEDAGVDLNFRSPSQIVRYITDKLGLPVESSDVETLRGLDHPFAAKLLRYRTIEKQLNFIEQFEQFGARTGRLYPTYNQARAATGRMSSSKFNLQQVPKRGEGRIFRTLFKAVPGKKLIKSDYSAIEMRVLAKVCNERTMIHAIQTGVDLHRLTASKTVDKPMDDVTKEERQRAKAVNFGFCFGMGAPTFKRYAWLQYGVKVTEEESIKIREAYFDLYKDLATWHIQQKNAMYQNRPYHQHSHGRDIHIEYVAVQQTVLGRKRWWPNYAGNTTASPSEYYNSAVQGTASDLLKAALVKLYEVLPAEVHIIAAIHDEILLESPEDIADQMKDLLVKTMCDVGNNMLSPVPIDAEGTVGDAWGG